MNDRQNLPIIVGGWACLIVWAALLGGCTVSHDRQGNPNGVGFFLAASEKPTDAQRLGGVIQDTAATAAPWLPAPYGELLTAAAGAVGVGVLGARQRRRENEAWDEAVLAERARRAETSA